MASKAEPIGRTLSINHTGESNGADPPTAPSQKTRPSPRNPVATETAACNQCMLIARQTAPDTEDKPGPGRRHRRFSAAGRGKPNRAFHLESAAGFHNLVREQVQGTGRRRPRDHLSVVHAPVLEAGWPKTRFRPKSCCHANSIES